uniref:Tyrosinase copper-binding domain-containing protein n=1 Tax=Acrobeloides nanus TaxID=290746 RepID=A0A914CN13_9BILA
MHYHHSYGSGAHGGPAFVIWHREFTKRFELALRIIDPSIALPYWDSTMDQILPDPKDSIMWTHDFMGSVDKSRKLDSGPFKKWITLGVINKMDYSDKEIHEGAVPIVKLGNAMIKRNLGSKFGNTLIEDFNITTILSNHSMYLIFGDGGVGVMKCNDSINWLGVQDGTLWIEKTLESIHGAVHQFVGAEGGDMGDFQTAVGDPVFFLLHGFVDFIFEMWRQTNQNRDERESAYRESNSSCHITNHYLDAEMRPFKFQGDNPCYNGWCKNIEDERPCDRCQRGICSTIQTTTVQTTTRIRNPFTRPTQRRPPNTLRPPHRTTPRPHTQPSGIRRPPSVSITHYHPVSNQMYIYILRLDVMITIFVALFGHFKDNVKPILNGC